MRALIFVLQQHKKIVRALLNSFSYSLLTVLFTFCICFFPAQVFAYADFRLKRLLESLALAPAIVPAITFSIGIHYVFIKLGLADTLAGIVFVLTIFSYPYMLRSLVAGFLAFGVEYGTCARNLGAGMWMKIVKVDLPLLLPSIVAGSTVVFLVAFSNYFLVFLIGGGTVQSYTGFLVPFLNSSDRSVASILTLLFLVLPVLLFFITDAAISLIYKKKGML